MKTFALITPCVSQTSRDLSAQEPGAVELRRGLSDDAFVAFFQPQLSLKTGAVTGVEVLARWRHPRKGMLTPGYFLEAIERHGLLDELFLRLFEQGLVLRQKLASLNLPLKVSFNLQPSQLNNPLLIEAIKVLLRTHLCPAHAITLEVTETGTLNLSGASMNNLLQLKQLGCGLSMDDFGTGFSSLERLCDVPFTELKLDASFVRKLDTHSSCKAIIRHALSLADSLGLTLVVEGVETLTQLNRLKAKGCTTIQGYVIAPPMTDNSLMLYILEHHANNRVKLTSV